MKVANKRTTSTKSRKVGTTKLKSEDVEKLPENNYGIPLPVSDTYNNRVKYCTELEEQLVKDLADAKKRRAEMDQEIANIESKRLKTKKAYEDVDPAELSQKLNDKLYSILNEKMKNMEDKVDRTLRLQEYMVAVQYNRDKPKFGGSYKLKDVPFIIGNKPSTLPLIQYKTQLDELTTEQMKIYIKGYGHHVGMIDTRTTLKEILAQLIGISSPT